MPEYCHLQGSALYAVCLNLYLPQKERNKMTQESLSTKPLFDMHVTLKQPLNIGKHYAGHRMIFDVESGYFEGGRLSGRMRPSGGDWLLRHPDGSFTLDVRVCLETDEEALIYMFYRGRWAMSPDIAAKVLNPATCAEVDKDAYYLRNLIMFETSARKYQWLNDIVAVSQGEITPVGISYYVSEVC